MRIELALGSIFFVVITAIVLASYRLQSLEHEIQHRNYTLSCQCPPLVTCPSCPDFEIADPCRTMKPQIIEKEKIIYKSSPCPRQSNAVGIDFSPYIHRAIPKYNIVPEFHFEALVDIVIVWKYSFSKKWRVDLQLHQEEINSWMMHAYPFLKSCQPQCAVWLLTSLDWGEWPKHVQESFRDLQVPWALMMGDMIAKMLMIKFQKHGDLVTFVMDADDFVEKTYIPQALEYIKKRKQQNPNTVEQICFRPKGYKKVWPFAKNPFYAPYAPGRTLRIMMGIWARGIYNDATSMNHAKFEKKNYVDCSLVRLDSFAFYVQRKHSSSSKLSGYGERVKGKKDWNGGSEFNLANLK